MQHNRAVGEVVHNGCDVLICEDVARPTHRTCCSHTRPSPGGAPPARSRRIWGAAGRSSSWNRHNNTAWCWECWKNDSTQHHEAHLWLREYSRHPIRMHTRHSPTQLAWCLQESTRTEATLVGAHIFFLLREALEAMATLDLQIEDATLAARAKDMARLQVPIESEGAPVSLCTTSESRPSIHRILRHVADDGCAE